MAAVEMGPREIDMLQESEYSSISDFAKGTSV